MNIFFAVDGSAESLDAIRQVSQFMSARTDEAAFYFAPPEIIVRHAAANEAIRDTALKTICATLFAKARSYLPDEMAAKAVNIVARHTPREGILIEADSWGADMIVVGARGMSSLERFLLGSVSRSVVQSSQLPVYVARNAAGRPAHQPFRVLYAFDGSASCTIALAAAERLALPENTEVTAVSVVDGLSVAMPEWIACSCPVPESLVEQWRSEVDRHRKSSTEQLTALLKKHKAPFDRAKVVMLEGHPADQILNEAVMHHVDLVVIGSGGKGSLSRTLLGSTSDRVLTHAPCSVLIARAT